MKIFKRVAMCLVLFISAYAVQASAEIPNGSIMFAAKEDGGGETCGVPTRFPDPPALPGEYYKVDFNTDPYSCNNDQLNYFKLENVPSATFIMLRSDYSHVNTGWKFTLKTYINPVSTEWIYLATLKNYEVGAIVAKGIILVEKELTHGDQINELSSVWIMRSALP